MNAHTSLSHSYGLASRGCACRPCSFCWLRVFAVRGSAFAPLRSCEAPVRMSSSLNASATEGLPGMGPSAVATREAVFVKTGLSVVSELGLAAFASNIC